MNNRKHILLITPGFPEDENDFHCIPPLQDYLIGFKVKYPETKFSVIALHYPHKSKNYKWNEIQITSLGGRNSIIKKPFIWRNAIRQAKLINSACAVTAIHSLWFGECALIGNFISKKINCNHICTLMGQDVKSSNKYLSYLRNKKIKIVALSKNQDEQFYKLCNRNSDEIIHWGIDDQNFSQSYRDIDLLAVGSLIPLKNYSLFLRITEEIIPENSKLKAVLVGSGPEELKLKRLINEKKLAENIKLAGLLNRTEIFKLMRRSRIFVHPSKFEGSGYVFAEALANGMNIVSFDVGYAQPDKKWFLANDETEFIMLTKKLLQNELDYTPLNLFPISETINRYAELYGVVKKNEKHIS